MAKQYRYNPRKETRFNYPGLVVMYSANGQLVHARGRDLSRFGIGIELPFKLKGYRLGAKVELEFALPNHLRGLKILVQLKRVNTDSKGHDHCGFTIVDESQIVKKRVGEIISFYEKTPKRFIGK
ncbi:MAG: PilZ domain-containing protein [Bdellovibrionales bacterium]